MNITVRIEGISPLIVHKVPDHLLFPDPGTTVYGGQKDTPRNQADSCLYMSKNGNNVPIIPNQNLFKCIIEGGKFHKIGRSKVTTRDSSLVPAGIAIEEMELKILFSKPWEVHSQMITNQTTKGKVPSHRPRFDEWALEFTLAVDTSMFDVKLVRAIVDDAGKKIGLGARRPECKGPFGRFVVTKWKRAKTT